MISRIAYREKFAGVLRYDFKPSKSPAVVFSTLNSDDLEGMIVEMEGGARASRRLKNPCAHFCFSLGPDEVLSNEQWSSFFSAVAEAFGALHSVGVTHGDTRQVNAHLVMSRVGANGKAWSTSNDRFRLRTLCAQFENTFGLRVLPERSEAPRVNKTEVEKANRLYSTKRVTTPVPPRMQLAETVRYVLSLSRTPKEFGEQLAQRGIEVRWRIEGGAVKGTSYAAGDVSVSGRNAGITVRALRAQLFQNEPSNPTSRSTPASSSIDDIVGNTERAPQRAPIPILRTDGAQERTDDPKSSSGKGRRYYERGRAAHAESPQSLTEMLSETFERGCLALLGLLEIVLADSARSDRRGRWPTRRPFQPLNL